MKRLRYRVVDVFTKEPLLGNPLAVFLDADGLDAVTMQKIAKEMNLSETTFVTRSTRNDAAANVRIFTTTMEMTFAGHPTIGTSYVLRSEGIIPEDCDNFGLEEKVGLVPVRFDRTTSMLWLTTPAITFGKTYDRTACARSVGLDERDLIADAQPQLVTAGNPNVYLPVVDEAAVDRAWTERAAVAALHGSYDDPTCIFVFTPTPDGAYSRMFAPELGVVEDPATGSATGPLAAYMMQSGMAPHSDGTRFVSEQGTKMGRKSLLHVLVHGDYGSGGIEVGGNVAPLSECIMSLAS